MRYNLPFPNVQFRKRVHPQMLRRGSVVAFRIWEMNRPRTGIIVMYDNTMMLVAINLYDENEGGVWYMDELPNNIELYEAEKKEKQWGLKFFLENQYIEQPQFEGQNPYIAFIDNECPRQDYSSVEEAFCKDFLSQVPNILDKSEWESLKQLLWQTIQESGGLQFNRFRTEYYCFLIGVLMIAESWNNDFMDEMKMELFKREWHQFSWMYGMAIGRVIGTALNNFTAVVNQTGQNNRKHYLHLYLPLVENNIEKICSYKVDTRYKLEAAIRKARGKEELEEQKTDLDELYHILFPKHFTLAMADSRPAATIADLKEKLAERDRIISKLQTDIDNVSNQYKKVLEQLKNAVDDVENDRISGEDLTSSFLRFPTELALSYFGTMSSLFALNPTWQKYAPRINDLILAKQKEQQDRQNKIDEAVKNSLERPMTQINNTIELVGKKETNIGTNYGPNIENNGTLSLPEDFGAKALPESDDDKQ